MREFLSKDTQEILDKYDNAKPIEFINGIEICAIDKKDLDFLLGYTEGSLAIEVGLKEKVRRYEEALQTIMKDSELVNGIHGKASYSYPGKIAKKALEG